MLIPKLMREKTRAEKCVSEVNGNYLSYYQYVYARACVYDRERIISGNYYLSSTEFNECCLDNGIKMIIKCRKQNDKMKECMKEWYYNDVFIKECTEEYLNERSEYRKTGIPKKHRKTRLPS